MRVYNYSAVPNQRWCSVMVPEHLLVEAKVGTHGRVRGRGWPWSRGEGGRLWIRPTLEGYATMRVQIGDLLVSGSEEQRTIMTPPDMTMIVKVPGQDQGLAVRTENWALEDQSPLVTTWYCKLHLDDFDMHLWLTSGVDCTVQELQGYVVWAPESSPEAATDANVALLINERWTLHGALREPEDGAFEVVGGRLGRGCGASFYGSVFRVPEDRLPGFNSKLSLATSPILGLANDEWTQGPYFGPHKPKIVKQWPAGTVHGGYVTGPWGRVKGASSAIHPYELRHHFAERWNRPWNAPHMGRFNDDGDLRVDGMKGCVAGVPIAQRGKLLAPAAAILMGDYVMLQQLELMKHSDSRLDCLVEGRFPGFFASGKLLQEWAWCEHWEHAHALMDLIVGRSKRDEDLHTTSDASVLCDGLLAVADGLSDKVDSDSVISKRNAIAQAKAIAETWVPRLPAQWISPDMVPQMMSGLIEAALRYCGGLVHAHAQALCQFLYPTSLPEYEWLCGAREIERELKL